MKVRILWARQGAPYSPGQIADLIDLNAKLYPDVTVEKIRVPDDAEGTRKLLAMTTDADRAAARQKLAGLWMAFLGLCVVAAASGVFRFRL